jgi:hypothetical protein
MTSTVKYQSLNHSAAEIRLVRILPAVTVPANFLTSELGDTPQPDLVSCQLEHFSLKDPQIPTSKMPLKWEDNHDISSPVISPEWRYDWGDYVALSYTWGDPRHTRSVVIWSLRFSIISDQPIGGRIRVGGSVHTFLLASRRARSSDLSLLRLAITYNT